MNFGGSSTVTFCLNYIIMSLKNLNIMIYLVVKICI